MAKLFIGEKLRLCRYIVAACTADTFQSFAAVVARNRCRLVNCALFLLAGLRGSPKRGKKRRDLFSTFRRIGFRRTGRLASSFSPRFTFGPLPGQDLRDDYGRGRTTSGQRNVISWRFKFNFERVLKVVVVQNLSLRLQRERLLVSRFRWRFLVRHHVNLRASRLAFRLSCSWKDETVRVRIESSTDHIIP